MFDENGQYAHYDEDFDNFIQSDNDGSQSQNLMMIDDHLNEEGRNYKN